MCDSKRMLPRFFFLLLSCVAAFAQTATSNSVTVTANRSTNVQPDQAVFTVEADTPLTGTLNDAVNALQGSGIASSNFTSVSTVQQYNNKGQISQTVLAWYFSLSVPLSDLKSTIGLLSAVQKSNGSKNNGIAISFSVSGTAVSAQAAQSQTCSQSDLLSDARAQAQKLAAASGKGVGTVLAMSSSVNTTTQSSGPVASSVSSPACSLTVKFQLTGF